VNKFNLIFESWNRWIISQIGTRSRDDGGNEAELGWNGRFADTMAALVELDEMFRTKLQLGIVLLQRLPVEINGFQDPKFISESTRLLGLVFAAAAPVKPRTFAVVFAKVA
jgi:hypothetical protein